MEREGSAEETETCRRSRCRELIKIFHSSKRDSLLCTYVCTLLSSMCIISVCMCVESVNFSQSTRFCGAPGLGLVGGWDKTPTMPIVFTAHTHRGSGRRGKLAPDIIPCAAAAAVFGFILISFFNEDKVTPNPLTST